MKQLYLVRNPMVFEPSHPNHYSIITEEELQAKAGIAYAGDPGAVLATLIGNDVIVKKEFNMEEIALIKAIRAYTGKNMLQCKVALDKLKSDPPVMA